MVVILLGPPGAGKGTQAVALAQKINLSHISTGDILRENVIKGTDLGQEAKSYMDKGALVPDVLVNQMLARRFDQQEIKTGFILDGYPRNLNQAKGLDEMLVERNTRVDLVFYLDTSEPVIIQRLTGRLVCKSCGANFHIQNMPPRVEMVCDFCKGALYQRADDNEDTVKTRLGVYRKEAAALIEYYESGGKLYRLNADEEASLVLEKMIQLIRGYHDSPKI